jgi:colicin import membrane protein
MLGRRVRIDKARAARHRMGAMLLPGWRRRAHVAVGMAAAGLLAAGSATAQTADDHAAAEALVQQLEHDTAHTVVTADAVASAKGALERAIRLRAAGDEAHAKAADGLALEWAQTGRDLAKAADAEATAAELRRKAVDAQALLERTRAQVEEGIAHVGRLRTQLQEAEKGGKVEPHVAVEVHEGDPLPPRKKVPGKKGAPDAKKPAKAAATGGAP